MTDKDREIEALKARAKALEEAAVALVAALDNMGSSAVCTVCTALATRHDEYTDQSFCDDHEIRFEVQHPMIELPHAAPLRNLRALLVKP